MNTTAANPSAVSAPRRSVRLVVIHCSATPNDRDLFSGKPGAPGFRTPAMEIDAWHKARGFKRDTYWRSRHEPRLEAIGYHFVIARNGAVFAGRHPDEPGAHAEGWNSVSIGVCLVGTDVFTPAQWQSLEQCARSLAREYALPLAAAQVRHDAAGRRVLRPGFLGHRDLPGVAKACPGFEVGRWLADLPERG